jgi:hypothetical protein
MIGEHPLVFSLFSHRRRNNASTYRHPRPSGDGAQPSNPPSSVVFQTSVREHRVVNRGTQEWCTGVRGKEGEREREREREKERERTLHIHTHIHTYTHTYTHTYARTHVRTDVHTYTRTYTNTHSRRLVRRLVTCMSRLQLHIPWCQEVDAACVYTKTKKT